MSDERKQVALITGAGRGIGRAVAEALAAAGMDVALNFATGREAAEETEALCRAMGAGTLLVQGDVSKEADCRAMVEMTVERFGGIDCLVNNAGITRDGLLVRMTEEDLDAVLDTNLKGCFLMMRAAARPMMKQRYGRIINMASVVGLRGNAGQVNYAASKGGVIAMTKSFAAEMASRGITVNAVAPGFIDTDMTRNMTEAARREMLARIPLGRPGRPQDVAEAVRFLASSGAAYITGQCLVVDGGMRM